VIQNATALSQAAGVAIRIKAGESRQVAWHLVSAHKGLMAGISTA
jgi:hypothetical protein